MCCCPSRNEEASRVSRISADATCCGRGRSAARGVANSCSDVKIEVVCVIPTIHAVTIDGHSGPLAKQDYPDITRKATMALAICSSPQFSSAFVRPPISTSLLILPPAFNFSCYQEIDISSPPGSRPTRSSCYLPELSHLPRPLVYLLCGQAPCLFLTGKDVAVFYAASA